jgi:hypothetical protein
MSRISREPGESGAPRAWQAAATDGMSPSRGSGPRALSDVLSQLQTLRGHGRSLATRQLADLWGRIAGSEISGRTKVIGLRNGVLSVGVANAALLGELTSFHQHRLLEALRGDPDGRRIRKLKFQLRGQ